MYVSKELALILKEKGFDYHKFDLIIAPTEQEAVDWIFDNLTACDINDALLDYDINQLKFWYTTLLEHKFGLMHEFIGRLEEWFESNNIEFTILNNEEELVKECWVAIKWNLSEDKTYYKNSIKLQGTYTKQQAKHEGIMKCFELLKTNGDEE